MYINAFMDIIYIYIYIHYIYTIYIYIYIYTGISTQKISPSLRRYRCVHAQGVCIHLNCFIYIGKHAMNPSYLLYFLFMPIHSASLPVYRLSICFVNLIKLSLDKQTNAHRAKRPLNACTDACTQDGNSPHALTCMHACNTRMHACSTRRHAS